MEEEQADVRSALAAFSEKLDRLESAIRPVIAALDELRAGGADEDVPPLVRARVDATLAYALTALFCMYLRTQGQDPASHPVREEIVRVRAAYVRIHELTSGQKEKNRPRKRAHARLNFAESELANVLTEAERELHQAVNGVTKVVSGNGRLKQFDSSEEEGDGLEENAVSKDESIEKKKEKKKTKKKGKCLEKKSKKRESSIMEACESDAPDGGTDGGNATGSTRQVPPDLSNALNSAAKGKKKRKHRERGVTGELHSSVKRKSMSKSDK